MVIVLYYLAVVSVSKYNSILHATERDEQSKRNGKTEDLTVSESSTTSLGSYSLDAVTDSSDFPNSKLYQESGLETGEAESSLALSFTQEPDQSLVPTSSFTLHAHALDISEQVEAAMELTGPFICQLLVEHKSLLSKIFVGGDGKSLLSDGEEPPVILCGNGSI